MDKFAGFKTQIRTLEKQLKEMDHSKLNPSKVKEITEAIQNLKNIVKEKEDKREERRKKKEEVAKAKPTEVEKEADGEQTHPCNSCGKPIRNVHNRLTCSDCLKTKKSSSESTEVTKESTVEKFAIDSCVEPVRGTPGSVGVVIREAGVNGDPLVYVKWNEGHLKEVHGEYGAYYPSDLRLKAEVVAEAKDPTQYVPREQLYDLEADLKSNYEQSIKNLEEEHTTALEKGEAVWAHRLEEKINDLRKAYDERFSKTAENGSGGTDKLKVVDLTPAHDKDPQEKSTGYGGDRSMGALVAPNSDENSLPLESSQKEAGATVGWNVYLNGKKIDKVFYSPLTTAEEVKKGLIDHDNYDPRITVKKEASLNKNSINITVAEKLFIVNPLERKIEDDGFSYDVSSASNNQKLFKITAKNELGQEELTTIIGKELGNKKEAKNKCVICSEEFNTWPEYEEHRKSKHGAKMAKLISNLAFLKKGSFVSILSTDENKKQVKFSSLDGSLRGWAPMQKFAAYDVPEAKLIPHEDHKDEILGESGNELLVTCPANSMNVLFRPVEPPPATPESLNPDVASKQADVEKGISESLEDCPQCGGPAMLLGTLGQRKHWKCRNCGIEFSGRAVDAAYGDKRDFPKIEIFVDGTYKATTTWAATCAEAKDKYLAEHKDLKPDQVKCQFKKASLTVESHIRHEDGKWIVYSHDFKKKLGEYDSKSAAEKRLRQIEFWKRQSSMQPLSKKEAAQLDRHGSDLYILPNSPEETKQIINFLNREGRTFQWSHSDVEGQPWFGKRFIEVPFGEYLEPAMRNYFKNTSLHTKNVEEIMSKKEASAEVPMPENKCEECGKELGPEAFLSKWPVCGKCTKKRHERAVGKKADQDISLETQVQNLRDRMSAVTERLNNPPTKTAAESPEQAQEGEKVITTPELIESIERGIDLLETKVSEEIAPEQQQKLEEMENLLWSVEDSLGLSHPLPPHEDESAHADVVKERGIEEKKEEPVEKESAFKTPKPTTPPPAGMNYVYDEDTGTWSLITGNGVPTSTGGSGY